MNDFGSFGSKFSSYSAFNKFATKPPILVNENNEFVGYLTINDYKTPSINTYAAIGCADGSFTSSNWNHDNIVFKDIPDGSNSYSSGSGYSAEELQVLLESVCPTNSFYADGECTCNVGYVIHNTDSNRCIPISEYCQNQLGSHAYGLNGSCYCVAEYETSNSSGKCEQIITCPSNSTKSDNSCVCNSGYIMSSNQCISHTQDCRNTYGSNVIGTLGDNNNSSCSCVAGYQWNSIQTACKKIPEKVQQPQVKPQEEEKIEQEPSFKINESKIDVFEETVKATLTTVGAFRDCPSTQGCSILRYYAETANVDVLGKYDDWYKVSAKNDSGKYIEGWMHSSLFNDFGVEEEIEQEDVNKKKEQRNEIVNDVKNEEVVDISINEVESENKKENQKWYQKIFNFFTNLFK